MRDKNANVHMLGEGPHVKARVQHPQVKPRKDRPGWPWVFRCWSDEVRADGSIRTTRKYHCVGPSKGEGALTKREAEVERDKFLATINRPNPDAQIADGQSIFSKVVEKYISTHVTARVGNRYLLAKPSRLKYLLHLEQKIIPGWGDKRLCDIKPDEVQQWLFQTSESWHMMNDLRGIMSGIFTKAQDWGYWPESRRNPISRVDIGEKWVVRPDRILTQEQTVRVLARLRDPNLLILETAIATGARISEILGLTWRNVDLEAGIINIVQRNWRGDIDDPKSKTSKRPLTLGNLSERYRAKAEADNVKPDTFVFVRTDGSGLPLWDSGVRQALKRAAKVEGCDFMGLGPHSFRRAYITFAQEAGGSSIEVSKMAGHSNVRMTEEYTKPQLKRREELTLLVQGMLTEAVERSPTGV